MSEFDGVTWTTYTEADGLAGARPDQENGVRRPGRQEREVLPELVEEGDQKALFLLPLLLLRIRKCRKPR